MSLILLSRVLLKLSMIEENDLDISQIILFQWRLNELSCISLRRVASHFGTTACSRFMLFFLMLVLLSIHIYAMILYCPPVSIVSYTPVLNSGI